MNHPRVPFLSVGGTVDLRTRSCPARACVYTRRWWLERSRGASSREALLGRRIVSRPFVSSHSAHVFFVRVLLCGVIFCFASHQVIGANIFFMINWLAHGLFQSTGERKNAETTVVGCPSYIDRLWGTCLKTRSECPLSLRAYILSYIHTRENLEICSSTSKCLS